MRKIIIKIISALCTFTVFFSCQNDENIGFINKIDLSKQGSNKPELLIGKWNIIAFAYTEDGNKISDVAAISKGSLTIPCAITPIEYIWDDLWDDPILWKLSCGTTSWYSCSLFDNIIELKHKGSTYQYIIPPNETLDIIFALTNVYSFVIKGDMLIFYFTGIEKYLTGDNSNYYTEKIKNKNLLILKKQ